jgi:ribosomal protein L11 methyltransferase
MPAKDPHPSPEPKAPSPGWLELSLSGPGPAMEAVADFLTRLGSGGAVFSEDRHGHPGHEQVTAFLPKDDKLEGKVGEFRLYLDGLRRAWPEADWGELETRAILDQDWAEEWKKSFSPMPVGERFWVVPSWREVPAAAKAPGQLVIRLDPGMAFGTGLHATTRACLREIETRVTDPARSVLDFGTGSGILAIAARMLGAERVLAVDLDPVAVEVAQKNLEINGLSGVEFRVAGDDPDAVLGEPPFDLILANIFAPELIRLCPLFLRHLAPSGRLVLAGILHDQAAEVETAFAAAGLSPVARPREEEWVSLIFESPGQRSR